LLLPSILVRLLLLFARMEAAAWFVVWTFFIPATNSLGVWKRSRKSVAMVKHTVFGVERDIDISKDDFPTPQEIEKLEEAFGEDCEHGWFDSVYGGAKLHYRKKIPTSCKPPKAIVCWMHGIQAHGGNGDILKDGRKIEKAFLADAFVKEGFAFYAHDMYGHGYSEGTRRWIPASYETNVKDFESLIRLAVAEQGEDTPVFLGAESYGGTVTIHVARRFQDNPSSAPKNFKGILLMAPAIIAELPPQPVFFILKSILAPLFPKWAPFFMPNPGEYV
jgi:alpha-beta hydrolase superfamily lysophospholipase